MNTNFNLDSLAGRAGAVLVAIHPSPCRGPLAAIAVTKPAVLCMRQRGLELTAGAAYVKGGTLFCRFTTTDLAAALPVVRAYFDELGCQNFAQLAYRPAGELEEFDFEPKPHRSYSSMDRWTWRDRLRDGWKNCLSSPRVSRAKVWWFNRRLRGDIAAAFVVLATAAALVAWLGAFHGWPVMAVIAASLSGLAFAAAIVTRPLIPLDEAERLITRAMRDGQDERKEFLRQLKGESRDANDGGPRE